MENNEKNPHTIFLFGAGVSKAIGIPTSDEFIDDFISCKREACILKPEQTECLQEVRSKLPNVSKNNVEQVQTILNILASSTHPAKNFMNNTRDSQLYDSILKKLNQHIFHKCFIGPNLLNDFNNYMTAFLESMLKLYGSPLHIFSLNYDTFVEASADRHRLNWADGFNTYWEPKLFDLNDNVINIYKLHGSVLWYHGLDRYFRTLFLTGDNAIPTTTFSGDNVQLLTLNPFEDKTKPMEPFDSLRIKFRTALKNCRRLIVAGYSFRDENINIIIRDEFARDRNKELISISPHTSNSEIFKKPPFDPDLNGQYIKLNYSFRGLQGSIGENTILAKILNAQENANELHRQLLAGGIDIKTNKFNQIKLNLEGHRFDKANDLFVELYGDNLMRVPELYPYDTFIFPILRAYLIELYSNPEHSQRTMQITLPWVSSRIPFILFENEVLRLKDSSDNWVNLIGTNTNYYHEQFVANLDTLSLIFEEFYSIHSQAIIPPAQPASTAPGFLKGIWEIINVISELRQRMICLQPIFNIVSNSSIPSESQKTMQHRIILYVMQKWNEIEPTSNTYLFKSPEDSRNQLFKIIYSDYKGNTLKYTESIHIELQNQLQRCHKLLESMCEIISSL